VLDDDDDRRSHTFENTHKNGRRRRRRVCGGSVLVMMMDLCICGVAEKIKVHTASHLYVDDTSPPPPPPPLPGIIFREKEKPQKNRRCQSLLLL
jgi:hypothetical protein